MRRIAFVFVLASVIVALPVAAQERKDANAPGKKRAKGDVSGIVKQIDSKVGTLAIQFTGDGKRGDGMFQFKSSDLPVWINSEFKAKLTDLKAGMRVTLALSESNDVTAVRVLVKVHRVTLGEIDIDKKLVTLSGLENAAKPLVLAPDAKIVVNRAGAKLSDLKVGQSVDVLFTLDQSAILSLNVVARASK